jgi:hypothetical protein
MELKAIQNSRFKIQKAKAKSQGRFKIQDSKGKLNPRQINLSDRYPTFNYFNHFCLLTFALCLLPCSYDFRARSQKSYAHAG